VPHVHSRSRSWTLHLLYGWELTGTGKPLKYAREALARRRIKDRYRPHMNRLLRTVGSNLKRIDELITQHALHWKIERMDAIDRNILRIGIAELHWFDDVPAKVAIHEAVKLAGMYGGKDSPRFVNGVLDAVFKEMEEARP
jgi:N utilization substance protein B